MSCNINNNKIIPWRCREQDIIVLYPLLREKKEYAGELVFDNNGGSGSVCSKKSTIVKGRGASVKAPETIVNYHTHPRNCYLNEQVIWGWPSGEDMRESILFGLRGNIIHFVLALEGIYTIQVNPCIIQFLYNNYGDNSYEDSVTDRERGVIIGVIEEYFKLTHVLRTVQYNQYRHDNNQDMVTPMDWVKLVNSFKLSNLLSKKRVRGCGNIQCNGFPVYDYTSNTYKLLNIDQFMKTEKDNINFYNVSKYGNEMEFSKKRTIKSIKSGKSRKSKRTQKKKAPRRRESYKNMSIKEIIIKVNKKINKLTKNCKFPLITCDSKKTVWDVGKWFHVCLFQNDTTPSRRYLDTPEKTYNWVQFGGVRPGNKLPVFYFSEMSGNCGIKHVKNMYNNLSHTTSNFGKSGIMSDFEDVVDSDLHITQKGQQTKSQKSSKHKIKGPQKVPQIKEPQKVPQIKPQKTQKVPQIKPQKQPQSVHPHKETWGESFKDVMGFKHHKPKGPQKGPQKGTEQQPKPQKSQKGPQPKSQKGPQHKKTRGQSYLNVIGLGSGSKQQKLKGQHTDKKKAKSQQPDKLQEYLDEKRPLNLECNCPATGQCNVKFCPPPDDLPTSGSDFVDYIYVDKDGNTQTIKNYLPRTQQGFLTIMSNLGSKKFTPEQKIYAARFIINYCKNNDNCILNPQIVNAKNICELVTIKNLKNKNKGSKLHIVESRDQIYNECENFCPGLSVVMQKYDTQEKDDAIKKYEEEIKLQKEQLQAIQAAGIATH